MVRANACTNWRARKQLEVRHFDEAGKYQSELMTSIMREVASRIKCGWLFFLDADEFLMVRQKSDLVRQLKRHRIAPALRMIWLNAYPTEPQTTIVPDTPIEGYLELPRPFKKVAINLRHAAKVTTIVQGNHDAVFNISSSFGKTILLEPRILHLPIRTEAQIRRKSKLGLEANGARRDVDASHSTHWKQIAATDNLPNIRWLVYSYGHRWNDIVNNDASPPKPTLTGRLDQLVDVGRKPQS